MSCARLHQRIHLRAIALTTTSYPALVPSRSFTNADTSVMTASAVAVARRAAANTGASGLTTTPQVVHYSKLGMDGFTDIKFNTAADELLELVETKVDALDSAAVEDVSCNGGVLTLETTDRGTFILNKQAPSVQLWLSSPISGPHHYDMVTMMQDGHEKVSWKSDHDGHDLVKKLEKELTEVLGTDLKL
ncbi:frataxin-like protein [Leishmania mexicana MHOM/GT/2001/U1103]|uniref:ferroxidase n=1 Tax=Leishmania mexicana (strain MHOM/GT/2001/U1103) TaxID=929439 RepID=E9AXI4_LEIMU|nr:frataxin-like protein [Leishmania mexicana MHOM/GT/2001/U1103]CBZ27675.1 frataxin-like protein [Leishmania mexicana MHOM/GT/2001/U1103]